MLTSAGAIVSAGRWWPRLRPAIGERLELAGFTLLSIGAALGFWHFYYEAGGVWILASAYGALLFTFGRDTRTSSRCTGKCSRVWVPFITHGTPRVAAGSHARKRLVETIRRPDGQLQVTYNHEPLYRPPHNYKRCVTTYQFGGAFSYIDVSGEQPEAICGLY